MQPCDAPQEPQRGVALRERLSLALMFIPLAVALVFLITNPSVWSTSLAAFLDRRGEVTRLDSGWMLAATLVAVLLSTWSMTRALELAAPPNVGLAMFVTICAMLYGVLCAALSPRDASHSWHEDARGEAVG